jgi:hypothetical protein
MRPATKLTLFWILLLLNIIIIIIISFIQQLTNLPLCSLPQKKIISLILISQGPSTFTV